MQFRRWRRRNASFRRNQPHKDNGLDRAKDCVTMSLLGITHTLKDYRIPSGSLVIESDARQRTTRCGASIRADSVLAC